MSFCGPDCPRQSAKGLVSPQPSIKSSWQLQACKAKCSDPKINILHRAPTGRAGIYIRMGYQGTLKWDKCHMRVDSQTESLSFSTTQKNEFCQYLSSDFYVELKAFNQPFPLYHSGGGPGSSYSLVSQADLNRLTTQRVVSVKGPWCHLSPRMSFCTTDSTGLKMQTDHEYLSPGVLYPLRLFNTQPTRPQPNACCFWILIYSWHKQPT